MPKYCVSLPIEKAFDRDLTQDDIESWQTHRQIVRGNVCYAELNEAHAEKVED